MYEYACPDCKFQFERVQKFEDKPIKVCPNCKKRNAHRVISRVAVSFKGGGFYVNDSKSSNPVSKGEPAKTDTAADSKSETGTNGTADTATASKSESATDSGAKTETKSESKTESKSEGKTESKPAKTAKKSD